MYGRTIFLILPRQAIMQSYKFEDKKDDADFLAGRPVICKAFFKTAEVHSSLSVGDAILVVLSSGKKYKGLIKDIHLFQVSDITAGELIIVRQGLRGNA